MLIARLPTCVTQRQPLSTLPLSQLSVQGMWEESKKREECQRDTWEGQGGTGGAEFCRSRTFEEWEISFQKKQCLMFKDFFLICTKYSVSFSRFLFFPARTH